MDVELIIARTRKWVEEVVVGHNFCPFAKPGLDRTHYQLSPANTEARLQQLLQLCLTLRDNEDIETALLIAPEGLQDFDDYLDELALAEALLSDMGFDGEFQLASFHPDYCFAGVDEEAAENYTNRSPYPIFHLLREASLSRALTEVSSPEKIPERNRRFAQKLGADKLAAQLRQCRYLQGE